ncbi:MAG: hypothetical protein IPI04_09940 [Ignavibacteria bacterium]|nr:hypothetical protein [Ignavibacteria bacterium]MBK7254216.1 hypothetical protein [Ignavibacteria bacterium]
MIKPKRSNNPEGINVNKKSTEKFKMPRVSYVSQNQKMIKYVKLWTVFNEGSDAINYHCSIIKIESQFSLISNIQDLH